MMLRRFNLCLLALMLAIFLGCGSRSSQQESTGAESKVADPDTRVVLTSRIDRTNLGIAERIRVHLTLAWEPPASVELSDPNWATSDWTLIGSTSTPLEASGGRFRQECTYLLEPFLPGAYQIPSFTLTIIPEPGARSPVTISTEPLALIVTGVLGEDDAGRLNPPSEPLPPLPQASAEAGNRRWLFAGIASVLVVSVILVLRLTRSNHRDAKADSIHERLVRITKQSKPDRGEGYAQLQEVYGLLDPRLRQTTEISRLMAVCERARFAPSPGDAPSPAALARHMLELLGGPGEEKA